MIRGLLVFVEWMWWSGVIFACIYYGVDTADLSKSYENSAKLVNFGVSLIAGFIATGLNHESAKIVRFTMPMIGFVVLAWAASSIGGGPNSGLTFLRGLSTTALAISLGVCSFLITDRKATAENRRLAHQLNHKQTERLMLWGLFDRAVKDDAVFDDGRINLSAR